VEDVERDEGKGIHGIGRGDGARRAEDVGKGEDGGVEGEDMVEWRAMVLKSKRP